VLIKLGLGTIPPILFAGMRYFLAFLILLAFAGRREMRKEIRGLSARQWRALLSLGLVYYTLTQGAQFLGLAYLAANTLSLLLTLSVIAIAVLGQIFLNEKVSGMQWTGIIVSVAGALVYFGSVEVHSIVGIAIGGFAVLANSSGALMGRKINRGAELSPMLVTLVSMGAGSIVLLAVGLMTESFLVLNLREWAILFWLAGVNSAFAFTLWNRSLQVLSAAQSGVINNTMMVQIAILAWIFLGERLDRIQITGLIIVLIGTLLVQIRQGDTNSRKASK
jgi:drug/metabolite transporter (DMT)-like permease